jgi:polysaccharide pyruvyl transferase CsaB
MSKLLQNLYRLLKKEGNVRFFVLNASGGPNFGDELIMEVLVKHINQLFDGSEIISVRKNKAYIKPDYGNALVKIVKSDSSLLRKFYSLVALIRTDIFIMGGGGLVQDYGLEHIRKQQIEQRLNLVKSARSFRRKVVALAIGAGPIETIKGRAQTKEALNKVNAVTTRDEDSSLILRRLGVHRPKISITADLAFAVDKEQEQKKEGKHLKVGISVLPLYSIIDKKEKVNQETRLVDELVKTARYLIEKHNAQVHLIPMDVVQDTPLLKEIQKAAEDKRIFLVNNLETTRDILNFYSSLDLVIGARFHSLVFSIINNVPFVTIDHHPKVKSISKKFGEYNNSLEFDNLAAGTLNSKVDKALGSKDQLKERIRREYKLLNSKAKENFLLLSDLTES